MQMDDQDESSNVEDARGSSGFQFRPAHGIGLGTIAVALIGGWLLGINPIRMLGLLSGVSDNTQAPSTQAEAPPADDPQAKFVSQILRSTEVVWGHAFEQMGRTYQDPKLLLYRDQIDTACGLGQAAAGPFYCPNDRRGVPGPRLLRSDDPATGRSGSIRARLRRCARGGPPRAEPPRHDRARRCGSRCERTKCATRAAGRLLRRRVGQSARSTSMDGAWSRATSRRRYTRRLKSGMTPCSGAPPAPWYRIHSPTARVRNAFPGSNAASTPAASIDAIPSERKHSSAARRRSHCMAAARRLVVVSVHGPRGRAL